MMEQYLWNSSVEQLGWNSNSGTVVVERSWLNSNGGTVVVKQ